jgi:lysophospholipase
MKLVSIPGNAIPAGAKLSELTAPDGTALRAAVFPLAGARGTVVIANGRGDFIERYFETIRDLQKRKFAVAIFDFRGQGGSARPHADPYRSRLGSFSEYDSDLKTFMTDRVLGQLPEPYIALGHSTGAHVLLRALRRETWFQRAVLSAPLLGIHTGRWPFGLVRLLASLATFTGLGAMFLPGQLKRPLTSRGFDNNPFTSDAHRFKRDTAILEAEPSLGVGGPSFSWLRAALKSMDELARLGRSTPLKTPVLIVAAGADRVVDTRAAFEFASRVPGISFISIEGARHELLCERNDIREQVLAAFDAFVGEG